jgi:diadenosine tetraphosphate (Ap4A) HIT family hydrolase
MNMVDPANSRSGEQAAVMEQIVADGICPFCLDSDGHLPKGYHQKPILKEGRFWLLTENQWGYKNARIKLLAILKVHVERLADLDPEAAKELIELGQWAEKEFQLRGGALCMRFGETKYSSATVLHLHAHIISPDVDAPDYQPVRFKIGASPKTE